MACTASGSVCIRERSPTLPRDEASNSEIAHRYLGPTDGVNVGVRRCRRATARSNVTSIAVHTSPTKEPASGTRKTPRITRKFSRIASGPYDTGAAPAPPMTSAMTRDVGSDLTGSSPSRVCKRGGTARLQWFPVPILRECHFSHEMEPQVPYEPAAS